MCYQERAEAWDIGTVAQHVDVGQLDRVLLTRRRQSRPAAFGRANLRRVVSATCGLDEAIGRIHADAKAEPLSSEST